MASPVKMKFMLPALLRLLECLSVASGWLRSGVWLIAGVQQFGI
jgi:hypothetical protein